MISISFIKHCLNSCGNRLDDGQILMAIDDSESMADCGAGALALAAMTTVASGLTQLEAGQLAVAR